MSVQNRVRPRVVVSGGRGPSRARILLAALAAALLLLPASACRGRNEGRGIVLIVLDSLRRDHLSYFGYDRPTSPFLDGLMRRGVVFRNVYSAAPQTVPSVSSLLTGLYPFRHGSHYFSAGQSYHPTRPVADGGLPLMKDDNLLLAEALGESGWRTAMVSTNPGVRDIYGFGQGIQQYRYIDCFAEGSRGFCDGRQINKLMAEDVLPAAGNGDYFVFLHYMDVHYPYYKDHSFQGRFMEFRGEPFYVNGPAPRFQAEDLEYSMACYDEGIIHLDTVLEGLFGVLERSGRLDDTLVIIVSDHGDEFLEHGGLGHGTTCYNELIHSFILFVHPRLNARDIDLPAGLTDVFPTLLEWAGVAAPERLDGASLGGILRGENPARAERSRLFYSELGDRKALIDGPLKFHYNFDLKTAELYDLASDPAERNNLALLRPEETARCEKKLRNIFNRMAVSYSETRLDEREKQNLKSLGYIR